MSECENCNEPYLAGGAVCEKCPDVASSGKNELVTMPRSLTAENGAKALLSGEFHEETSQDCPYCDGSGWLDVDETMECDCCDGRGYHKIKTPVTWTTIKEIYAMAVKHLAS